MKLPWEYYEPATHTWNILRHSTPAMMKSAGFLVRKVYAP